MINTTQSGASPAHANANVMRSEIGKKWPKITAKDIATMKYKDELVAQVQSKYQLDKMQAQRDVDTFAKGRQL